MMDFSNDFLFLSIFFPIWTCMLIVCCAMFLPFDTKKLATSFSLLGTFFPIIFAATSLLEHSHSEIIFPFITINELSFYYGAYINKTNSILIGLFSLCLTIGTVLTFNKYKDDNNLFKYLFLLNLLNVFSLGFFVSPNLIQMFTFFILFSIIFYILENIKNENHERAKNFLVINKIGDYTLLGSISALFFFSIFFNFSQNSFFLEIKELNSLFESIQSVCEPYYFILICILLFIAVLIKTVLIFIHPLKSKIDIFIMASLSLTCGIYWFSLFIPIFNEFEYLNTFIFYISLIFIIILITTLYFKKAKHDIILKINNSGTNIIKKIYMVTANTIRKIDRLFFDKIYENISQTAMNISGYFQFTSSKTTLYAFIFNILGICFLIFTAWIIFQLTMKG